jgi:hypothetical protein
MEFFINDMKNLPLVVERRLSELRQMDATSSAMLKSNAAEVTQLFDDVAALAKSDPDFDEGPVLERFNKILTRRHDALAAVDEQMKKIQKLYDLVDGRLTYIGRIRESCHDARCFLAANLCLFPLQTRAQRILLIYFRKAR